jgi:hypothetical protein
MKTLRFLDTFVGEHFAAEERSMRLDLRLFTVFIASMMLK